MSSIENRDVKSLSEIQSSGGQKSDLTHDSKIYVTAKGLNKTLSEIIESGEIADGNRFGADIKNFAIAVADGSGEEYHTNVPFLNGSGNTQLDLTFEVKDLEVSQLYVDGNFVSKWISDDVNKNMWWKIIDENSIEIKGDLTSQNYDINFIVFRGSEIPVVPSVFSGLSIEQQAFGFTDSPNGDGVSNVVVAEGKTNIEFSFDLLQSSVVFVYVNGELYPAHSPANTGDKWYKKLSKNIIQLGSDLSGNHDEFYVAVFQGKSFIDQMGNMVVTLKPEVSSFIIESTNGTKWYIGAGLEGEIVIDSVVTAELPDRILFRRDDSTVVELFIEDDGNISVDVPVNSGILFETIYLSDLDGLVREFKALDDNTPYTIPHGKNHFELLRPNGNVLKRFTAMENNAVMEYTGYSEKVPDVPVEVPNNTVLTSLVRSFGGGFNFLSWDTIKQKWGDTALSISTPFGVAVDFYGLKEKVPSNFRIADGQFLSKEKYPVLFSVLGTRYGESEDKLSFKIPDLRGVVSRGVDDGRGFDVNVRTQPEGSSVPDDEKVGSYQTDGVKNHTHPVTKKLWFYYSNGSQTSWGHYGGTSHTHVTSENYEGTEENTMKNVACYKIMKVN